MENKNTHSTLFVVISGMYITCLLLCNLVAGKLWQIADGFVVPSAVILFPVTYIIGDILTEVYGFRKAKSVIWLGFACSFFAVIVYFVTIALPYPVYFTNDEAYRVVLGTAPRVAVASLMGYLFGEFSNSAVLSKLKVITKGRKLWLRAILSTIVGEGFDTVIFITVSFIGTMSTGDLLGMMIVQYLFKVCYEAVFMPITYLVTNWIKGKEGMDTFDYNIKYNFLRRENNEG